MAGRLIATLTVSMILAARGLSAQSLKTDLTLASATVSFPAPSATDYVNGYVDAPTGVTFTVDATNGIQPHTTTVLISATSANLGNGKLIGDLQWRRSDLTGWNSITAANVQVEQRNQIRGLVNDPWSNTIFFRLLLDWTKDSPATYAANYRITLSQTVP
ncbi:MAG: hypothetical protein ABR585_05960 [Gemmatimonadaceae bacterium]